MKFLVMIYSDDQLLGELPSGQFEHMMQGCFRHADELAAEGSLLGSQQLEHPVTARTVRVRDGKTAVFDGPFAETREYLAGFNLIEAADMDEAVRMALAFPWARTGCIELRPVRDIDGVRRRVSLAGES